MFTALQKKIGQTLCLYFCKCTRDPYSTICIQLPGNHPWLARNKILVIRKNLGNKLLLNTYHSAHETKKGGIFLVENGAALTFTECNPLMK